MTSEVCNSSVFFMSHLIYLSNFVRSALSNYSCRPTVLWITCVQYNGCFIPRIASEHFSVGDNYSINWQCNTIQYCITLSENTRPTFEVIDYWQCYIPITAHINLSLHYIDWIMYECRHKFFCIYHIALCLDHFLKWIYYARSFTINVFSCLTSCPVIAAQKPWLFKSLFMHQANPRYIPE